VLNLNHTNPKADMAPKRSASKRSPVAGPTDSDALAAAMEIDRNNDGTAQGVGVLGATGAVATMGGTGAFRSSASSPPGWRCRLGTVEPRGGWCCWASATEAPRICDSTIHRARSVFNNSKALPKGTTHRRVPAAERQGSIEVLASRSMERRKILYLGVYRMSIRRNVS